MLGPGKQHEHMKPSQGAYQINGEKQRGLGCIRARKGQLLAGVCAFTNSTTMNCDILV